MKSAALLPIVALVMLAGCKQEEAANNASNAVADFGALDESGRYSGIGTYPSDSLWNDIEGAAATNDVQAARQGDDSQVIVVVDRRTGEVRQCGNRSGFCISMNPWKGEGRETTPGLPVQIDRHLPEQAGNEASNVSEPKTVRAIKQSK